MLGKLKVILTADMTEFARNMGKAVGMSRRDMRQLQRDAGRAMRRIAMAAAAAGAAMVAMAVRSMGAIDKLAKTSDKLGVPTEALAGLQHAAELSGVSVETFNMALQRMVRRVAEAANGTGEAVKALKELGIDAEALNKLSPDKQFERIAEAMEKVSGQGDRVRLAMKLFDSEGVALVNTLGMGVEGLQQAQAEAEKFGTAIGRVAAKQVENANDALTRAKGAATGFGHSLAVGAAPYVEHIGGLLTDAATESDGFADSITTTSQKVIALIALMVEAFDHLRRTVRGVGTAMGGLAGRAATGFQRSEGLPLAQRVGASIAGLFGNENVLGGRDDLGAVVSDALEPDFDAGEWIDRIGEIAAQSRERAEAEVRKRREMNGPLLLPNDELEAVEDNANKSVDAISTYADQAARNIESSFADFLFDPFKDGLKGMLKGFVDTIRRMVAEAAAAKLLGGGLGGALSGFLGWMGLGGLPGRAVGGPVSAQSSYMVGENGPEVFVPQTAGRIEPNLKNGGTTIQMHNTFQAGFNPADAMPFLDVMVRKLEVNQQRRERGLASG